MAFAETIAALLDGFPPWLVIGLMATLPVIELRGAIPFGLLYNGYDLMWHEVFLAAVIGNLIPVPFILLLMGPAERFLRRWAWIDRLLTKLFDRTIRKTSEKVKRYEAFGLTLFVAIPLPVTGAWTGALAAYLLKLGMGRSLIAIACGVVLAGAVVTTLVMSGRAAFLLGFS